MGEKAIFSNPVRNRVLESCSYIIFTLMGSSRFGKDQEYSKRTKSSARARARQDRTAAYGIRHSAYGKIQEISKEKISLKAAN